MSGAELPLVREAFESNFIAPLGPMVDAFEREFAALTGQPHAVALASGTAAMHLALRELGVGPGATVIAASLTFIASVSPATFLGAAPVFLDCDRTSWTLDPDLLAEELAESAKHGRLPKAVIPTDLYGQCCDLDRLREICASYGVPLVVDSAEAMGARYRDRHAGVGARAAVYSFNGNKIITTSGGGMLASDDARLIERARFLSTQARLPFPHYEHSEIGYNYRLSNVSAAIGRGQLRVLEERVARRRTIFERYRAALGGLPGIAFMPEAPYGRCTRWLTVMQVQAEAFGATPADLRVALEKENIESRPVWKPMHLQPVFRGCSMRGGAVCEELFAHGLCLPSGSSLLDEDLDRIIGIVRRCCAAART
jgi:dTDP-4-amino-4,6-dideoxygalactose transaminase